MGPLALVGLGCLGFILLVGVLGLLRGWVFSWLWAWFVTPLGLPEISVVHAWGLAMMVSYLTAELPYQGDGDEARGKMLGALALPFICLGVGYILKGYM